MTAKEIAQLLAKRAEEVAKFLFPNGQRVGNEYCVGSLAGEAGQSLKICVAGDKTGYWCDFATGEKGDLVELFRMASKRSLTLIEAVKEAKEYLGMGADEKSLLQRQNEFSRPDIGEWNISALSLATHYLTRERKLTPETIAKFKIGTDKGNIVFPYYRKGELIQVKYLSLFRENQKKKMWTSPNGEPCLFGWDALPLDSRYIVLTEGEIDCMTLHQYGYPALSIPFGGGKGAKHQWIEYDFDLITVYDEIYLCLDNDEVGNITAAELADRLGRYRCKIVALPYKDANECLQKGVTGEEIKKCFDSASTLDPSELRSAKVFAKEVIDEFYPPSGIIPGISAPWDKARDKIRFRPDELSLWVGINGHGKTLAIGQVALHSMREGAKICIASLELKPKRFLMRLVRQAAALPEPSERYINEIHNWLDGKLWIFDLVGTAKGERIIEVFKYARQRYGVDVFIIDSLMKCDISEDDYKKQKSFLDALCDFKNEFNCHVHLIVHPRKGASEDEPPSKLDIKGTGAISDLADNCFTIWRNKKKEEVIRKAETAGELVPQDTLEKYDCAWICDKQRNGDWEGWTFLWFDPKSYQFLNHQSQKPIRYIDLTTPIDITQRDK